MLAFGQICARIQDSDWEVNVPHPGKMGPYAHKGKLWVGYDDEGIALDKGKYVSENGLGGIMFWTIDMDDFREACPSSVRPFPLIESAKEGLYGEDTAFKT